MEAGGHSHHWTYCDRYWLLGRWITVFTIITQIGCKLPSPTSRPFRLRSASARQARNVQ
jgi:hypothetical protein